MGFQDTNERTNGEPFEEAGEGELDINIGMARAARAKEVVDLARTKNE